MNWRYVCVCINPNLAPTKHCYTLFTIDYTLTLLTHFPQFYVFNLLCAAVKVPGVILFYLQAAQRADQSHRIPSYQPDQLIEKHLHKNSVESGIMLPVAFVFIFYLVYTYYITPVQSNWSCKK